MEGCAYKIYSEEYADFISSNNVSERILRDNYNMECMYNVDNKYIVGYVAQDNVRYDIGNPGITIPRLFTTLNEGALESTNVFKVRNNPFLDLRGRGVMVGFVDTGID